MDTTSLIENIRLLDHPFYRRWEQGALQEGELASYAAQYRYFEAQLPSFLEALSSMSDNDVVKGFVDANLADEVDGPETHLALFDKFANAVDAPDEQASVAMSALVNVYRDAVASGNASRALGVLAGYEIQAADVAETKGTGLSEHYGVSGDGLSFWQLHAAVEQEHAAWTLEASAFCDQEEFAQGVEASANAWWSFLNEREALIACA